MTRKREDDKDKIPLINIQSFRGSLMIITLNSSEGCNLMDVSRGKYAIFSIVKVRSMQIQRYKASMFFKQRSKEAK